MPDFGLITLDPGHFHAALIFKEMYPGVARRVHVYAPLGPDLVDHLGRIVRFNHRAENPTSWDVELHCGPDFLDRLASERPGNVVVLSGRNRDKVRYIQAALDAGLNVLADKPWIIEPEDLPRLAAALDTARRNGLVAYDIMTERYEITSMLLRDLLADADTFGAAVPGSEQEPAVEMRSVHHIMKLVAGAPNLRPAWFFDIREQGEALSDVGTHLVDLAQWTLFPDQALEVASDVRVLAARRWPTVLDATRFHQVTSLPDFPKSLTGYLRNGRLEYFCNNAVTYTVRGVHVRLEVLWDYEAPHGDIFTAMFRRERARIEIRQGAPEGYRPEVYVVPADPANKRAVGEALCRRIEALQSRYRGVAAEDLGGEILLRIPERYRVGHEAHFAQVAGQFFSFLRAPGSEPAWEHPNMLAKYRVSTEGVALARQAAASGA
jgi:predicted dehydrogenase